MRQNYEAIQPCDANFVALSPLSFLHRTAEMYPNDEAVIYGTRRQSWGQVQRRIHAFADALVKRGIVPGDTVSIICPNIPEMFEAHFAVPMAGAVLHSMNTRLEADTIAYMLDHSDSKLLLCDTSFAPLIREAFALMGREVPIVEIIDEQAGHVSAFGGDDYEALVGSGDPAYPGVPVTNEWQAISLNYTSGTSGRPKGVVCHHRGAYLMSLGTVAGWTVPQRPTYMSIVPMFHCNGWNHPWAMTIVGARMVFVRDTTTVKMYDAIRTHKVTHFGAAPIILQMLAEAPADVKGGFDHVVHAFTAGAPPPAAVLEKMRALGFDVMHVYGLTETYGHVTQCIPREDWTDLPAEQQAEMAARQGVGFPMVEAVDVVDMETGQPLPADGETQGEIVIRGNVVMAGYYKDPEATAKAFKDGWFWSGDAAVKFPGHQLKIRDRLKDVIISGGENISSVEVEGVLFRHPAIALAAVVAMDDAKWGEVPCAFVELREGATATEAEIIAFCRERLAGFKCPKAVRFEELPKTSTGKIQKFQLRARLRA
jgi:fatty-acyl-CoA synthase